LNTFIPEHARLTSRALSWCVGIAALSGIGCQGQPATEEHPASPALRAIQTPADATTADIDRAALSRLVGAWNYEGWSVDQDSARREASGRAAGTIESEHFVLMDLQATSGELGGRAGRKTGSMIFASEPGVGPTMTAWGDASPSISRFVGRVEGNGSAFTFNEVRTADGRHRHALTIVFTTDNQWTAEVRNLTASGSPVVAKYQFTRSAQ
jgi:hypothetical protein